jgi:hypothetical protein
MCFHFLQSYGANVFSDPALVMSQCRAADICLGRSSGEQAYPDKQRSDWMFASTQPVFFTVGS